MDDLISRQNILEALDTWPKFGADERFRLVAWREGLMPYIQLDDVVRAIVGVPSVQPEITRCKECRFAHLTYDGDCKHCDKWTDEFGIPEELYLDGNFFCGYAERRTNE